MIGEPWQIDAIWLSLAFFMGLVAKRIFMPPLIGFLITGFVINALNLTDGNISEIIQTLSDLGVMLLLFTIGLKIKFTTLLKPEILYSATVHMVLSIIAFASLLYLLSFAGFYLLAGMSVFSSLMIGFALSFSSTVFVVKILEEKGELNSFHGKIAIGILVIQDIFAVIFIALTGAEMPGIWVLLLPVFLFIIRFVMHKMLDTIGHGEMLTVFGFFAAFILGAMSFTLVGLKSDLGALAIGMLLVSHPKSDELYDRMLSFKDFFLIAFFVNIGLSGPLTLNALLIALLIVPLLFLKSGLFLWLLSRFKIRARTGFLTSISLSNFSEFGLIVGFVALQAEFIDAEWLVALALIMSFSFFVSAPLNRNAHSIFDRFKPKLILLNAQKNCVDDEPISFGNAEYLIIGMGSIGLPAYQQMEDTFPGKVVGIDYSHSRVKRLNQQGLNIHWGDATDSIFWENADFSNIKLVLLTMSDIQSNLNSLKELHKSREKSFKLSTIYNYEDEAEKFKAYDVDFMYYYKNRIGAQLVNDALEAMPDLSREELTR